MDRAEIQNSADPAFRRQLAILACRKSSRRLGWPRHWSPTSVRDPKGEFGAPFTEAGAWEFIAELLDSDHAIEEVELRDPPGKSGYVLHVRLPNDRPLYIKLELGSGTIIGRSFHYSILGEHRNEAGDQD